MSGLSDTLLDNRTLMFSAAAVAFLVAALLILLVFRLAFGRRLRMTGGRTRQPRLGIVDAFDVDRQRQLVIIRRDNIEHLLMIGGPNDVLIEASIVRAEGAREPLRRDKEAEPKLGGPSGAEVPGRALEEAIGAALTGPPVPPGPSIPAPRAPVLPLPPRQRSPLSAAPSTAGSVAPPPIAPPIVSAPPAATTGAPPVAAMPPAASLRRTSSAGETAPVPRPPLLRVPPLRPGPRPAPAPAAAASSEPATPSAGSPASESVAGGGSAPTPEVASEKAADPTAAGQIDTFESLEEEMAKLLGRGGPGGG